MGLNGATLMMMMCGCVSENDMCPLFYLGAEKVPVEVAASRVSSAYAGKSHTENLLCSGTLRMNDESGRRRRNYAGPGKWDLCRNECRFHVGWSTGLMLD